MRIDGVGEDDVGEGSTASSPRGITLLSPGASSANSEVTTGKFLFLWGVEPRNYHAPVIQHLHLKFRKN